MAGFCLIIVDGGEGRRKELAAERTMRLFVGLCLGLSVWAGAGEAASVAAPCQGALCCTACRDLIALAEHVIETDDTKQLATQKLKDLCKVSLNLFFICYELVNSKIHVVGLRWSTKRSHCGP